MRYFLTLAYRGTRFNGWQRQPVAPSVQATVEEALSTLLRQPVELTGCGRTDAGVHARYYVAHFDAVEALPPSFLNGLNSLLGLDIAAYTVAPVDDGAHARYDAFERSYEYHLALRKDPFAQDSAWFFARHRRLDLGRMQAVADLLPAYQAFAPFCKTDSGLDSFACEMKTAQWDHRPDEHRLILHITANRFLRGMVRLIVGACINAGLGKITVAEVCTALDTQSPLRPSLSVPPQGLFLTKVKYPFLF